MKIIKFYYKFFVGIILFLGTFTFVFATNNVDIYRKIINNNFKKGLINSLGFDFRGTQSITGQGFEKLVSDFSLVPKSTTATIYFDKNDSYLNFNGFTSKEKTYFDLSLSSSEDNKEWIKLNFETRLFPKDKSLYFLLKDFNFTLTEKDLLKFSTNTLCIKDILSLSEKINSFFDREIENRWFKSDISLKRATITKERLSLINEIKNYLLSHPIFTLVEVKSSDKQLRKFELVANVDNLINLEKLFFVSSYGTTSAIEDSNLIVIASLFDTFFDRKIGSIYIDKKNYRIKKISFQLKQSDFMKNKYDLNLNLNLNIEPNVKYDKNIFQPSNYIKLDDLFSKFIKFGEKEEPLFLSIETNCQGIPKNTDVFLNL